MPRGSRRPQDEETQRSEPEPVLSAPEPPLLDLQRSAGNSAVTRLLARDYALNLVPPQAVVPKLGDPATVAQAVLADHGTATQAVLAWFDEQAKPHQESGNMPGSIPELVYQACELALTFKDGTQGKVRDKLSADEVEQQLRGRARMKGMRLTEHRDASDLAGVRSELSAVLANLGAIPTELTLGDDDAKVTASISGTLTGELKTGAGSKVEVEGSSEGVKATVTAPGAKYGLEVGGKGIKAEVKAGDLLTVNGSITRKSENTLEWKAEISVGTIGKLIMPEDVAKVFKGAQDTFSKSTGELLHNLDDPAKVKEHGSALAGAVSDAVEKAKKSAAQSQKSGWRVGAELKGDSGGGVSGSITLTWVF
jgi:hypothetical protein